MAKKNQNAPVQEPITSTGEIEKDLQGENMQNPVEEEKVVQQMTSQVQEVKKDLKVNIAFTDKYNEKISYKINDLIKADSISDERYDELLKDERKIVSIVE